MTTDSGHASIDWTATTDTTEEAVFDLLDALVYFAPAGGFSPGLREGSIDIAVDAPSFSDALEENLAAARRALSMNIPDADIIGIELIDWATFEQELAEPLKG
ncbi:hypothetical protein MHY20_09985 [Helcobacillus sp. ACRRO]|uniref:hypothetical protein n=1 Tax=Helcobacillus TaxID=1161125 RepID=UPI001EF6B6B6|nr:hypothetical protein [Helcobacillus sp. ACRRO]MCG7427930.1 hypothetical protein [Helcobacillus sp. ACRRO]